jgi:uncharacterized repeat protein (TIGR01451 family)
VSGYVNNGTMLRRYHYADRRTTAANLRFDTTQITPATGIRRGGEIEYTINVVNDGPDKAGHITFENPLPNGTTFVSFDAPEGWVSYQLPLSLSARFRVPPTGSRAVSQRHFG